MPPPKSSKRSSKKKETGAAIGFPLVVYPEDVAAVNRYKGLVPSWSYPYISRIIDVKPNGNCGFWAIVEGLGMGQNSWREVRVAMKNEMDRNPDWWRARLNTEHPEFFETTRSRLDFLETVQDAPRNCWFQLPAHGFVVAQAFNCVLILMKQHSSQTFFPMREGPDLFRGHPVLAVANVTDTHWLYIQLEGDFPVPLPVSTWPRFAKEEAYGWRALYENRINDYVSIMSSWRVECDPVDLTA
ncbi:uncharacterized protein LOC143628324 [Bidens hawaiensis]|uniref:uncharacterized protein LOC143628324 n=1 Tax=Bidens hawaiensis TaxID=980011 RepID=UPI00404B8499